MVVGEKGASQEHSLIEASLPQAGWVQGYGHDQINVLHFSQLRQIAGKIGKAWQAVSLSLILEAVDYLFQWFFVEKERPGPKKMLLGGEAGPTVMVAACSHEINPAATGTEWTFDETELFKAVRAK